MAPKTLLVFCDGTGMDGTLAPPKSTLPTPKSTPISGLANLTPIGGLLGGVQDLLPLEGGGASTTQYATNVLRLARSVKNFDEKGNKQIVFYQSGVGSESNFTGDSVTGTTAMQALGTAVATKIRDAYVFVAQNFEVGDEICLFGFSRGAYTARKLSALIDRIGLLTRENLGLFFEIWRQLMNGETPQIPSDTRHTDIKCVGVWDTVGSVYNEIDALNIADTALPKTVKVALHAVSLQENRKRFLPTLWTIPSGGLDADQVLKQVWFSGAHSDVGGGYERHELSDITLFWLAGEIKDLVSLDLEYLRLYSQPQPDPWGTSQPHNAFKETSLLQQPIMGAETRLTSKHITVQSVLHESVKYSPQKLTSPVFMATLSIIQQHLGSGFAPQYAPLNEFEQYCKDHWGGGLRAAPPVESDSPDILIRPAWVSSLTGLVPLATIMGGQVTIGRPLFLARATYQDAVYPGMADQQVAHITYGGKEIKIPISQDSVQFLVGNPLSVRWVAVSGTFSYTKLDGAMPVRGGNGADGTTLYIARAEINGGTYPGRVQVDGNAQIPYNGVEKSATEYKVLVYV